MIKLQDVSELAYGGLVLGLAELDAKRIEDGTLVPKEVYKSAKFWGYLGPGVASLVMNVLGKPRGMEAVTERVMHGFIYGFPQFIKETVEVVKEAAPGAKSAAVKEAERLLVAQRRSAGNISASEQAKLLAAGRGAGLVTPGIYVEEEEILA